jgi:hypothetical protein
VRRLGVAVPCIHLENSESLLADCIPDEEFRKLLHGNTPGMPPTIGYARSGGGMYGQRNHDFLKPAITVRAQIRHVHVADKGVPVGYDRSWVAIYIHIHTYRTHTYIHIYTYYICMYVCM